MNENEIVINLDEKDVKNIKKVIKFHKIFGTLGIIISTISCLTIIGAIGGLPNLFISRNFLNAGKNLEKALTSEDKEALGNYFIHQKRAMKIYFLFIVISLAFFVILSLFTAFGSIILAIIKNH